MASKIFSLFSFSFCFLLLCHGSMAQAYSQGTISWHSLRQGASKECRFDTLHAFEPHQRVQSEAGVTEYFDELNEQFRCSGVSVVRRVIQPQGFLLPRYSNVPGLVYIIQGRGVTGPTFPGCPQTYQQQFQPFEQAGAAGPQSQSRKFRDEHQKIHHFRQGDVIALVAGVPHWCYNDGDAPVVAIYVYDTNSNANQLEPRQREFLLAGNNNREHQTLEQLPEQHYGESIFNGFNIDLLSETCDVSRQVASQLKSRNDRRGDIIHVKHGLQFIRSSTFQQGQQPEEGRFLPSYQQGVSQEGQQTTRQDNGLDESFCTMKVRLNIEDPNRADTYNPRAGRITRLNSQKFPILNLVQMSATRVNLYQNAFLGPFWNINAHSVVYAVQGRARVQVVNNRGKTVFNGELRRGQLLIIPQNYVVLKKAQREGFQYVALKTNPNSMVSHFAGKNSIMSALPVDVIANAYRLPWEEARMLKYNRGDETGAFPPRYHKISYEGNLDRAEDVSTSANDSSE